VEEDLKAKNKAPYNYKSNFEYQDSNNLGSQLIKKEDENKKD
jgi:hypothetical protein